MSDYDREHGRLIPLCKRGEHKQAILSILEKEYPDEWKEYQEKWPGFTPYEALEDIGYEHADYQVYLLINDILYKNVDYERSHEVDFCNIKKDPVSGDIVYDTCYWNGGACLSDVLSDAIK